MTDKHKVGDKVMYFSNRTYTAGEIVQITAFHLVIQDMYESNIETIVALMQDGYIGKYGIIKSYDEQSYLRIVELESKITSIREEIDDLINSGN